MTSDEGFPAADVARELNPALNKDFQVDSVSSDVETAKKIKQEKHERKEQEEKDALHNFKTAIIVSGIILAVAGALFAITKKLREK